MKKLSLLLMAIMFAIPGMFAQSELKLMFSSLAGMAPVASATDQVIPETATPGVYEGVVTMNKSKSFAFYSGTEGEEGYMRYSAPYYTNITFTDDNLVWPTDQEENESANIVVNSANKMVNWTIVAFSEPKEASAKVKVTVNLNDLTLSLEQQPFTEVPEALYIWGSENGGRSFNVVGVMNPTTAGGTVFQANINVPEVGKFETDDPEFGGIEGDPDYGFKFMITKNGESLSGGQIYNGPLEDHVIEFGGDVTSYTTTLLKGTGAVLFDLTPGYTSFTFDYSTLKLTVALIPETDKLFVVTAPNYYMGPWNPSDDDMVLYLNPETGYYENPSASILMGKPYNSTAFKFYKKNEAGEVTYYGTTSAGAISLFNSNPYETAFEEKENGSAWYISKFNDGSDSGNVTFAVMLAGEGSSLIVTQTGIETILPDALYIWGSENGAADNRYYNMGTLLPSEENPMVYSVTFNVPDCPGPFVYDNPEFKPTEDDAPTYGFLFFLSPEKDTINKSNVVRYGAAINYRTIHLEDGENAYALQLLRNNGGAIVDQNPGKTLMTFNIETLEFNVVLQSESDDPTGVEAVESTVETITVYNLQGVRILDNADASKLVALPAGIYIVNGKKVMVGR